MVKKKVLIATGGSGGHVFPAFALAQQLKHIAPPVELFFAGGGLTHNPYFNSANIPYKEVDCGNILGKPWWQRISPAFKTLRGVNESRQLIRQFQPDVVVGFGSFHSFPLLAAARLCKVPFVLHESNTVPGRVTRLLSPYAQVTGVHFAQAQRYLKGRSIEVDIPLREGYTLTYGTKERARQRFLLHPDTFTFLVFGGSQGAKALNSLVSQALTLQLALRTKAFQVIHITGKRETTESLRNIYDRTGIRAYVTDFLEEMDQAWIAADLMIGRAGALTLAEMTEFEVPGILIPYPYASDHHQEHNADFIASEVKGGLKLIQSTLNAESLANTISQLAANDRKRLVEMRESIRYFKGTHRRRDLCSLVCEVGGMKVR